MSFRTIFSAKRIKAFLGREGVHRLAKSVIVVALAYAFAKVLASPLSFSLGAMSSMSSADFLITDMYQIVADGRDVRTISPDIVIVDVNNCSREQIQETIELVNLCNPKAVGVDVSFVEQRDDDESLVQTIANTPNVVGAELLAATGEKTKRGEPVFNVKQTSWFAPETSDRVTYAAANFPSLGHGGTIRNFKPYFQMEDGSRVPAFATALARMADPAKADVLDKRAKRTEAIYYPSTEFKVLLPSELYDRGEELIGKVVIVGVLNDPGDLHRTPLDSHTSGTLIQAYALNTILTGNYLSQAPAWIGELVALLLTFLFVYTCFRIKTGIRGILLRVMQISALYLMLYAGYWFFLERNVVIDFSRSFLMLAFALFSVDVWNGCYYAWNAWLWPTLSRKARQRRNDDVDSGSGQDLGLDSYSAGIGAGSHNI